MRILYPVKKKHSFKENAVEILPEMFDNMTKYRESVIAHPRMKLLLHRMRITGKPMRYLMEIMEPSLGREFSKCLHEIKGIIELMGDIHDSDVFVYELKEHLKEFREFNRTKENRKDRFVTSGVMKLIEKLSHKRKKDFDHLCGIIKRLENENFRNRLIESMRSDKTNEINYFQPGNRLNRENGRK